MRLSFHQEFCIDLVPTRLLNTTILKVKPTVLSAWLRLGTKYQLDDLRDQVITMLKERYPDTLKGYDEWFARSTGVDHTSWYEGRGDIVVLNLARKFGLHTLLPAIFLACSQLKIEHLVVDPDPAEAEHTNMLSIADLRRCIQGRESLHAFHMGRFNFVFQPDFFGCEVADTCKQKLKAVRNDTWEYRDLLDYDASLKKFDFIGQSGLCSYCEGSYTEGDEGLRAFKWGELRSVFGLDEELS